MTRLCLLLVCTSKDFLCYLEQIIRYHSTNDPHKCVINLEVFKLFFVNLNRNPRNNHVTSVFNSQLIVKSYRNENNDKNMAAFYCARGRSCY